VQKDRFRFRHSRPGEEILECRDVQDLKGEKLPGNDFLTLFYLVHSYPARQHFSWEVFFLLLTFTAETKDFLRLLSTSRQPWPG